MMIMKIHLQKTKTTMTTTTMQSRATLAHLLQVLLHDLTSTARSPEPHAHPQPHSPRQIIPGMSSPS
jgi:hypothetical protein